MNIGQKVKVTRKGLMSTEWVGTVVSVGALKVEVQFPNHPRTLSFSRSSIKLVDDKKPEAVKKIQFIYEREDILRVVFKTPLGKLRGRVTRFVSFDEAEGMVKFIHGLTIPLKSIVVLTKQGEKVKFSKPDVNGYPFWVFNKDEVDYEINSVDEHTSLLSVGGVGHLMHPDWLAKDVPNGFEMREIEQPGEPPEDAAEVYKDYTNLLKKHFVDDGMERAGMSFSVFYYNEESKPELYINKGAACHYAMKTIRADLRDKDKCKFVFGVQYITRHYHHVDKLYKEHTQKYLEWVMNDSPWSRYIITKSFKEALATGIRIKLNIPSNAMMCTFYALRYPTEYSAKIKNWNHWVNLGMNGSAAYFVAETNGMQADTRSHHQLLDTGLMSLESVKAFVNNKVGATLTLYYTETLNYSNVSAHHGELEYEGVTGVAEIRDMDIYGEGVEAIGGAFAKKEVKAIDEQKLVNVMNGLVE